MKFTAAWVEVLNQNLILKAVAGTLAICSLVVSIAAARLALKEPLIIERGCYSEVAYPIDSKHTTAEIEAFVKTAIPARFDTQAADPIGIFFLSDEEFQFRKKEQEELSKKGLSQKVIVASVKVEESKVLVEADRIIGAAKMRSAVYFPLVVELRSISRSPKNSYGLILKRVSEAKTEESK